MFLCSAEPIIDNDDAERRRLAVAIGIKLGPSCCAVALTVWAGCEIAKCVKRGNCNCCTRNGRAILTNGVQPGHKAPTGSPTGSPPKPQPEAQVQSEAQSEGGSVYSEYEYYCSESQSEGGSVRDSLEHSMGKGTDYKCFPVDVDDKGKE